MSAIEPPSLPQRERAASRRQRLWRLPPATFSGGEQQRVNITRGFAGDHSLRILDEPTASLDAENCDAVVELIAERRANGAGFSAIFHDEELLARRRRLGPSGPAVSKAPGLRRPAFAIEARSQLAAAPICCARRRTTASRSAAPFGGKGAALPDLSARLDYRTLINADQ